MSDDSVIVLSDDCPDADGNGEKRKSKDHSISRDSDGSEFEFPIVRFSEINYVPSSRKDTKDAKPEEKEKDINNKNLRRKRSREKSVDSLQNLVTDSLTEKDWSDSDFPLTNIESYDAKNNCRKSENDSDYESQYPPKQNLRGDLMDVELSDDREEAHETEKTVKRVVRRKKKAQQTEAVNKDSGSKLTKKQRPKVASKTNPKDCMKSMEVIIDEGVKKYDFFNDFSRTATENELKYSIKSQLIPNSITWKRRAEVIYDEKEVNIEVVDENQLVIIWDCEETIKHVSENTLIPAISNIKSMMPCQQISLILYKTQGYFKYSKSAKDQTAQSSADNNKQNKNRAKTGKGFSNYSKVSREQLEDLLVEIQMLFNAHSRLIDNADDMILMIKQYTKSLATRQSKMEKEEKLSELHWCISVDNKDSVKVDKDGNGFSRLWQQQLCQFPQASLETAEAITSVYKTPFQLMDAYEKCTEGVGEMLLKDIPIRRNAGILTSSKKIGPELSRKIYLMFTAMDGDIDLK
ncbi:crossover junction endonuclease EME1 [Copidosoma floridanum]|uniref:crossover junction endonuclease EME1 n=1 Tax=Copidosoma floridanum TaxID=29053 RepID=UPI0006C93DD0|nr:crossover junction endonuclease EME1 [Copidosoma floridanum]